MNCTKRRCAFSCRWCCYPVMSLIDAPCLFDGSVIYKLLERNILFNHSFIHLNTHQRCPHAFIKCLMTSRKKVILVTNYKNYRIVSALVKYHGNSRETNKQPCVFKCELLLFVHASAAWMLACLLNTFLFSKSL